MSKTTELILIVDRSGSMAMNAYHLEMENGINALINEQKDDTGDEVFLTLAQFDSQFDIVYDRVPIADVPEYKLVPRGSTALLDAVGKTINTVKPLYESDKPDLVMLCIVTDGGENASVEYRREQVRDLLVECEKNRWKVTYLGANQDAFAEAGGMGINLSASANFTMDNATKAYASVSGKMKGMRTNSVAGQTVGDFTYTADERAELDN